MKTISIEQLTEKLIKGNSSFKLINALESPTFDKMHIPNSLNYTVRQANELQFSKDDEIVVYCTNSICRKSIALYYKLESIGYSNVKRYSGGLMEWDSKGFPLENSTRQHKLRMAS